MTSTPEPPRRHPVAHGQPCIDSFFATLREVKQLTVKMEDGSVVTVTSPVQGRALLTFLGWTPPPPAG